MAAVFRRTNKKTFTTKIKIYSFFILFAILFVVVDECGWLWVVVGDCGWLWVVVDGCGWLWVFVDDCGWLWLVAYFSMTRNIFT